MEAKIVRQQPFSSSKLVICRDCAGRKHIVNENNSKEECPTCLGTGLLHRITEGTLTLTTIS